MDANTAPNRFTAPLSVAQRLRVAGLGWPRPAGVRRVFDDVIGRVQHRKRPVAGLLGLADDPQQLTGLDVGAAVAGPERDADLAAVVADDDRAQGALAPGDVLNLVDPAFEG